MSIFNCRYISSQVYFKSNSLMPQKISRFIILLAVIFSGLPFLVGLLLQDAHYIYSGFLLNPIDGFSYLAKMQIGLRGEWLFHLPYTSQEGAGAFLFLFYIFLGHIARIFSLQPTLVFHLARIAAVFFLCFGIEMFLRTIQVRWLQSVFSYLLFVILFGTGFGWLAGPLGVFTMDFWVAEAYPFLSMIANPHFPFGVGLLLMFFSGIQENRSVKWFDPFLGVILAIVLPFGVVVGSAVIVVYNFFRWFQSEKIQWKLPLFYLLPAGIVLVYQYFAILSDPLLREWNAQNQTPTPSLWVLLLSFAPLLLFALIGIGLWVVQDRDKNLNLVAAWLISGVGLAYFPFALQRRFLLGWFIPVGIFALVGLGRITKNRISRFRKWFWLILPLSLLTNLFLLFGALQAYTQHRSPLYLSRDEFAVLEWMNREVCPRKVVILTPADFGLLVPAYTNCRVVYGHPFETVYANMTQDWLEQFYDGEISQGEFSRFVESYQIEYLVWPRGILSKFSKWMEKLPVVYQNDRFIILETRQGS